MPRNALLPILFLVIAAVSIAWRSLPADAPPTVAAVDLQRYAGRWYEIARLPVRFQRANEMATADYALGEDGVVQLVNTAIKPTGETRSVTGTAVPVENAGNAKLKVTIDNFFARLFGSPPPYGNYWVLKLEAHYRVVLVGSPNRKTLWLLARDSEIPEATLREYLEHGRSLGYAVDRMIVNNGKFPDLPPPADQE